MIGLVKAELRKLVSTRTVWGLTAGSVALTALTTVLVIITTKRGGLAGARQSTTAIRILDTPAGIRNVMSAASSAEVLVLVLGLLAITGEYRHGTITQTFLTTPIRGRVVEAKLLAYALVGFLMGLLTSLVTLAIALPWLATLHLRTGVITGDSMLTLVTVWISVALYALLGVGVGALLRNQVLAIVVSLAWLFVAEGLLIGLVPSVGKWTPGGASTALHRNVNAAAHFLPAWGGGLVLAGYALTFAAAGTFLVLNRDVT